MSDQLGPDFDERLRAELDRFRPPTPLPGSARFSRPQPVYRRLGRMQLAVAMAAALAVLTVAAASAASGTDPSTWPQRAVTTVESVTHVGESSPPSPPERLPETQSKPPAHSEPSTTKTAQPERESPETSDGSHSEASPKQSHDHGPSPSPNPEDGHSAPRSETPSEN